jgi:hypothetical protein
MLGTSGFLLTHSYSLLSIIVMSEGTEVVLCTHETARKFLWLENRHLWIGQEIVCSVRLDQRPQEPSQQVGALF